MPERKALDEVFSGTKHQRCWVHKTANVLNKFPQSMHPAVKADLREIRAGPRPAPPPRRPWTPSPRVGGIRI
jgi:transposase-like protein